MALVFQSVIFENATVQVSYYEGDERDEYGMEIRTAVINPIDFKSEVDEVFDSLSQLLSEWKARRRQIQPPAPGG